MASPIDRGEILRTSAFTFSPLVPFPAPSQPQFRRRIFAEERAVADIAADHGQRAVAGLAHDGELAGAVDVGLGGEAGAQGMAG